MRQYLFLFFLCTIFNGYCQYIPSDYWHEGFVITLEYNDTLSGSIKYDLSQNIIQIKKRDKIATVSSRNILYYKIFDEKNKYYRIFYSLDFSTESGYKVPMFFELIQEGRISLLAREYIVSENISSFANPYSNYGNTNRKRVEYTFYLLNKVGDITIFKGSKKEMSPIMEDKWKEVETYIKQNNLSYNTLSDVTKIISYYNSLYQINYQE
ncbi:MAG: hypothetical protein QM536_05740 [Chitinophagaceae bacterium]|nr:hypothetical protein [Chitinophagaceae bacterium]